MSAYCARNLLPSGSRFDLSYKSSGGVATRVSTSPLSSPLGLLFSQFTRAQIEDLDNFSSVLARLNYKAGRYDTRPMVAETDQSRTTLQTIP
jgi:hypothetical protein